MNICGVKIDLISENELLEKIELIVQNQIKSHLVTTNPEFIVEAQNNQEFKKVLNEAAISVADGVGCIIALQYYNLLKEDDNLIKKWIKYFYALYRVIVKHDYRMGKTTLTRIAGVDLIDLILKQKWMSNKKVFLLGSRDDAGNMAVTKLKSVYSDIEFASDPGQQNINESLRNDDNDMDKIIFKVINDFSPDILLVGYGHPAQDIWISRNFDKLNFKLSLGVGGAFDFISGKISRAPEWMRNAGLEWLYRLYVQPGRIIRIFNATIKFSKMVVDSN